MAVYLGKNKVGVTIVKKDITAENINTYKYKDLTRVINNGGVTAIDEEYNRAEEYLQSKYALIMGG